MEDAVSPPLTQIKEQESKYVFEVKMSYLQIYMESVQDLLFDHQRSLNVREGPDGVFVESLSLHHIRNPNDVMALLECGENAKTIAQTKMVRGGSLPAFFSAEACDSGCVCLYPPPERRLSYSFSFAKCVWWVFLCLLLVFSVDMCFCFPFASVNGYLCASLRVCVLWFITIHTYSYASVDVPARAYSCECVDLSLGPLLLIFLRIGFLVEVTRFSLCMWSARTENGAQMER